jgi:hypothetical protein
MTKNEQKMNDLGQPALQQATVVRSCRQSEFEMQKCQMAYSGYYTTADYAEIKGVSRQHINRLAHDNKIENKKAFKRLWVKLDEGQYAVKLYGTNPIENFLPFGFKQRMKSLVVSDKVLCDVKLLDGVSKIAIRFYNESGDCLVLLSDMSEGEIIYGDGTA